MGRIIKDILEDDNDRKIRPLSMLLGISAAIFGLWIITNALGFQRSLNGVASNGSGSSTARQSSSADRQGSGSIMLKYNPLIEDTQRELLAAGFYKGTIDGVNGLRTKLAIQSYQQANGMTPTGEASQEMVDQIRLARKVLQVAQYTASVSPREAVSVEPRPVARDASASAPARQSSSVIHDSGVRKVQVALAGLGYEINTLDGRMSNETRSAILKYEMDNGMEMTGKVDSGLLKALKLR